MQHGHRSFAATQRVRSGFASRELSRQLLLAALIVGVAAAAAAGAGKFVRVKVETANVRSGPGTKYERLWTLERDFPLEVIAQQGRWLKTRDFLDSEGWIYAPLTDDKETVIVEVTEARVRSGPGPGHEVRFAAYWGKPLRALARKGQWVQIEHPEHGRGWIRRDLVWGP